MHASLFANAYWSSESACVWAITAFTKNYCMNEFWSALNNDRIFV